MIKSFRSKALRQFGATGDASRLAVQNADRVRRVLMALDSARSPHDMNVPGLKFHALKGRERGRFAVWVSGNYRITFGFAGEDVIDVDMEDYH